MMVDKRPTNGSSSFSCWEVGTVTHCKHIAVFGVTEALSVDRHEFCVINQWCVPQFSWGKHRGSNMEHAILQG